MPDRADYLARTLINRMRSLEEALADRASASDTDDAQRRVELVEKVLAVEAGVLDGATHRLLLSAMPTLSRREAVSAREFAEFAAFVRQHVPQDL
ncbi:MAG: hypothetical protein WDM96_12825 [Lacunisphaera sp.]